jgi:hypothetical protein
LAVSIALSGLRVYLAAYAYDGFSRRKKKVIKACTRDYCYSLGWQVIEELVGGAWDRQIRTCLTYLR